MAVNLTSKYSVAIDEMYRTRSKDVTLAEYVIKPKSTPWQPITYTSMIAWYLLNYLLLGLLLSLPILGAYLIWQ